MIIVAMPRVLVFGTALALAAVACTSGTPPRDVPPAEASASPSAARFISAGEVRALAASPAVALPAELAAAGDPDAAWRQWIARHRADVDARLQRGDEDSIVNLMLFGTTFTAARRPAPADLPAAGRVGRASEVLERRLDDLASAVLNPGPNERLQFARQVLERRGVALAGAGGLQAARAALASMRDRAFEEGEKYRARLAEADQAARAADKLKGYATAYFDRGLATDTSIRVDFALERVLEALRSRGSFTAGGVRRVAVVGPGLDFADKTDGHDFYPQQTIQPLAIIDSLLRLELSDADDLEVAGFDVSPRVIHHLDRARERARTNAGYVIHLPLEPGTAAREWNPELVAYWRRFGDQIGKEVAPLTPPAAAAKVNVRAIEIGPRAVLDLQPQPLDVVVQRLDNLPASEQFDLVVATNVLLYYGAFEQALAAANLAAMMKPGAILVANHALNPPPPFDATPHLVLPVPFERQRASSGPPRYSGDTFYCYLARKK
jgi:hypothetical protein